MRSDDKTIRKAYEQDVFGEFYAFLERSNYYRSLSSSDSGPIEKSSSSASGTNTPYTDMWHEDLKSKSNNVLFIANTTDPGEARTFRDDIIEDIRYRNPQANICKLSLEHPLQLASMYDVNKWFLGAIEESNGCTFDSSCIQWANSCIDSYSEANDFFDSTNNILEAINNLKDLIGNFNLSSKTDFALSAVTTVVKLICGLSSFKDLEENNPLGKILKKKKAKKYMLNLAKEKQQLYGSEDDDEDYDDADNFSPESTSSKELMKEWLTSEGDPFRFIRIDLFRSSAKISEAGSPISKTSFDETDDIAEAIYNNNFKPEDFNFNIDSSEKQLIVFVDYFELIDSCFQSNASNLKKNFLELIFSETPYITWVLLSNRKPDLIMSHSGDKKLKHLLFSQNIWTMAPFDKTMTKSYLWYRQKRDSSNKSLREYIFYRKPYFEIWWEELYYFTGGNRKLLKHFADMQRDASHNFRKYYNEYENEYGELSEEYDIYLKKSKPSSRPSIENSAYNEENSDFMRFCIHKWIHFSLTCSCTEPESYAAECINEINNIYSSLQNDKPGISDFQLLCYLVFLCFGKKDTSSTLGERSTYMLDHIPTWSKAVALDGVNAGLWSNIIDFSDRSTFIQKHTGTCDYYTLSPFVYWTIQYHASYTKGYTSIYESMIVPDSKDYSKESILPSKIEAIDVRNSPVFDNDNDNNPTSVSPVAKSYPITMQDAIKKEDLKDTLRPEKTDKRPDIHDTKADDIPIEKSVEPKSDSSEDHGEHNDGQSEISNSAKGPNLSDVPNDKQKKAEKRELDISDTGDENISGISPSDINTLGSNITKETANQPNDRVSDTKDIDRNNKKDDDNNNK